MPRGRVIDPVGQQSDSVFGYIKRFDGPDRPGKLLLPWKCRRKKIIPFLNNGTFEKGDLVVFEVTKIEIKDPELGSGALGIATNVRKAKQR